MRTRMSKTLVFFICFTLAMTAILSHTVYMWIGVAGALRRFTIETQRASFSAHNENPALEATIAISNPSEFTLWISYIAIKRFQVNDDSVTFTMEKDPRSFYVYDPPFELRDHSSTTINFSIPITIEPSSINKDNEWILDIRIHMVTVFTWESVIRLDVKRSYLQSEHVNENLEEPLKCRGEQNGFSFKK